MLAAVKQINELTKSIANDPSKTKKCPIEIRTIKVGISLPLGIGLNLEIPKGVKIPVQPPQKLGKDERILNLTFLIRLRDFAIK